MMRRLICAFPLLFTVACNSSATCDLVGQFAGLFEGDASGDLLIDVTENADDPAQADVEITLTTPDLEVYGSAVIACEDGQLSLKLETADLEDFGDFEGTLATDGGDGDWSFTSGETGTWSASR